MTSTCPFFPLTAALVTGILAGNSFPAEPLLLLSILACLLVCALVSAAVCGPPGLVPILLASVFVLGWLNMGSIQAPDLPPTDIARLAGKEVQLEGMVSDTPKHSDGKAEIPVDAWRVLAGDSSLPATGKVLVRIMQCGPGEAPRYGDLVRFKASLKAPRSFRNPGGFDYERHLLLKGVRLRATLKSAACLAVIRENRGSVFRQYLEMFRSRLRTTILNNAPFPESSIIQAMVLGEQSLIPREVYDTFSRTGTSHIIAISGFNISIIAFSVFFIIRSLMGSSEKLLLRFDVARAAAFLSVAPIIAFIFIAGLGISTLRAAAMVLVFLAALLFGREQDLPNALSFAAFAILMFSPASLFDVSFQLSFAAVAAITYLVPLVEACLPGESATGVTVRRVFRAFLLFCTVTLSAAIGTLPLILFYFNLLSLVILPANLALLPVLGYVVLFLSMGVIAVSIVSAAAAGLLVKASAFFVSLSIKAAAFLADLPWAYVYVPTPSLAEMAAFYVLVIAAAELFLRKKPAPSTPTGPITRPWLLVLLAAAIFFFAADGAFHFLKQRSAGRFRVTCLDVGQASSTYLEFPGGSNMLVDGSGFFDAGFDSGRFVVAPFLWYQGVRTLDYVVLTHPHPDHLNGLIFILRNFRVGEVWSNGQPFDSDEYREFNRIIREKNLPHRIISRLTPPRDIGGVRITFLNPGRKLAGDPNEDSIAMRLRYGEASLLMPSDILQRTENSIIAREGPERLKSDVIIAPHHGAGSSNSLAFLKAVLPQTVIISCGDNPYVPSGEVLENYQAIKAGVFRTSRDGAVTLQSDKGGKFRIAAAGN